ncbi:MAG TPA: DNA translocase FtsK, partial [Firmicutes bacterium]|nr:DNA translocase FtsK [Bacillota bacterium]
QKPVRVQGAFVSDKEVGDVVEFLTEKNGQASYSSEIEEKVKHAATSSIGGGSGFTSSADERDAYFVEAGKFVIEKEKGSIGMLQRMFKVGFNRAARIMDQLEEAGVVGPEEGTKPRKVLMSMEEFEQFVEECV